MPLPFSEDIESPRACAAFTIPKVNFWPGIGISCASSQVTRTP